MLAGGSASIGEQHFQSLKQSPQCLELRKFLMVILQARVTLNVFHHLQYCQAEVFLGVKVNHALILSFRVWSRQRVLGYNLGKGTNGLVFLWPYSIYGWCAIRYDVNFLGNTCIEVEQSIQHTWTPNPLGAPPQSYFSTAYQKVVDAFQNALVLCRAPSLMEHMCSATTAATTHRAVCMYSAILSYDWTSMLKHRPGDGLS